jgi:hypothetical protein
MTRALICGGRDLGLHDHRERVWQHGILDQLHAEHGFTAIIEGGATGADQGARLFGNRVGIPVLTFDAEWDRLGKSAGPIRNARMLAEGKPDVVIAFPGQRGTRNMVHQAEVARVRVIKIEPDTSTAPDGRGRG